MVPTNSTLKRFINSQNATKAKTLEASYKISLMIAKSGKNHTIGKDLIKPSISVFLDMLLNMKDSVVKDIPLRNDTVSRRDEMSGNV